MFYAFRGFRPVADPSAFVHPQACVTGNVFIGRNVYIGPGAALRGDWGEIRIEDGCNVQENVTIHMFPGQTAHLMADAHIGHGAVIHGATIGRNCLVGMNAVVMDHAVLGDECIVGALSFIGEGQVYAARSLLVGSPARRIREVSDEMIAWKSQGTALYQSLPADMRQHWQPCEPLPAPEADRPSPETLLETWHRVRQRP
jgi:phenylacetic acid degradation protein/carnitine operon protein CaiE